MNDPTAKHSVRLLLLDKLLLALVLATATFFFSARLQHTQAVTEYQRLLFERRIDAYVMLMHWAQVARNEASLAHNTPSPSSVHDSTQRWMRYRGTWGPSIGPRRQTITYLPYPARFVSAFDSLVYARQQAAIYMSPEVDAEIDSFMNVLWDDMEIAAKGFSSYDELDAFDHGAAQRATAAFHRLNEAVRRRLRVDQLLLG